ncbi:hypothetical protein DYB30_004279 [Aphanomyces astaci]|uniref:Ubiquitin-like domain-containing protein n=1 Tax=Aphanomyces astaci TaxID=112090 RepID=A0A397CPR5_APHAT|nr:hypothetical protein DYB30_004279 [Aphanomyces astaci]RHY47941.1 hypothetical protein DYB34_004044 [Aphanomyces astaci]RHY51455.1 hypothetical protein DYB38_003428 [Aphanomyces astaci]
MATTDACHDYRHSDPGGFDSGDLGSVSVFVQMHRMNDPRERKIKLVMKPWACVKDMKDRLQAMFGIPTAAQQLYYKGTELANPRNLVQCGLYADKVVVDLVLSANGRQNRANMFTIHPYGNHVFPRSIMKAAHLAMQALGFTPELAMDGTGGTYFLKDPAQRKIVCFKPQNEEPFGPCNPRGFVGSLGEAGFRKGVLSGEACEREVAAFLLDKEDHHDSLKSPLGFWASLDPFDIPASSVPMSPTCFTSPRHHVESLPSWEQLCQGFHADAQQVFKPTTTPKYHHLQGRPLGAREEKLFFRWLDHLIEDELRAILDRYANNQQ